MTSGPFLFAVPAGRYFMVPHGQVSRHRAIPVIRNGRVGPAELRREIGS